jgi:hypothetical protein
MAAQAKVTGNILTRTSPGPYTGTGTGTRIGGGAKIKGGGSYVPRIWDWK